MNNLEHIRCVDLINLHGLIKPSDHFRYFHFNMINMHVPTYLIIKHDPRKLFLFLRRSTWFLFYFLGILFFLGWTETLLDLNDFIVCECFSQLRALKYNIKTQSLSM